MGLNEFPEFNNQINRKQNKRLLLLFCFFYFIYFYHSEQPLDLKMFCQNQTQLFLANLQEGTTIKTTFHLVGNQFPQIFYKEEIS